MSLNQIIQKMLALFVMLGGFGLVMSPAYSAPLSISENPLFLTANVPPNVVVTLDDSGSMSRAFTPDLCGNPNGICDNNPDSSLNHRYLKSAYYNPIYYNPAVTYTAPVDANGVSLSTSFNHAWINGYATTLSLNGVTHYDLATQYRPTAGMFLHSSTKTHQFMNHYTASADLTTTTGFATHAHSGGMVGTNTLSNAPYYAITDYVNQDGSASGSNPGTNLISVTVNGTAASNVGTFTGTCDNSKDPDSNYQYKTQISGSTLTLCFRDSNTMYGTTVALSHKIASAGPVPVAATSPTSAYYYVYNAGNAGCTGTDAQKKVDNDCYTVKLVGPTSGPGGTDERQNFANWYSFYRTRNLATIASTSLAFAEFDASTRMAWQSLHTCRGSTTSLVSTDCEGWETTSANFSNAIKPFTGTHKQNFYTWLFRLNTNTSTPLHQAMVRAGDYLSTTGENSPYDDDLNTAATVPDSAGADGQLSCRKNFHVLMTDGIWSDTTVSVGNLDGSLDYPYKDSNTSSLADVAYKYWSTDLTTLSNNLLPYIVEPGATETEKYNNPKNNPATWQHMVNFTVGLGLTPFLESTGLTWGGSTYAGSYSAIAAGTKAWPDTSNAAATDYGRVSDLWHAAINSRGKFFSADTPETLVSAFKAVKNAIEIATPSAAALAANSTSIQTDSLVYQARFSSKDWSGDLIAYPVGLGGVIGAPVWNASDKLPVAGSRNIYTNNSGVGVNFSWGALSTTQQAALNTDAAGGTDTNGSDRLDWLRGVQTNEVKNGGTFRNRVSVLGDIINSDPAFAMEEDFGYKDMVADEASTYESYVSSKSGRIPAVFVGGNDGMLHAFRADSGNAQSGVELFAYVPNNVYPTLSKLTDPNYAHKYFVDAGPTVGDAYFSSGWNTVLVGGLGGGGRAVYALNVSDVASPSAGMLMWEYTDGDLGLTYSKPQIVRLNNGQWAAIFGNGYNSTAEQAYLYVVNLQTGALISKIPAGSATSNGLSSPTIRDTNGDMIADYAYAGDLQGNLWKFDLTTFAAPAAPLFIARNASNQVQPITSQPVIGGHPNGDVLVYFGTGQYIQSTDVANIQVQSFYGIWDKGTPISTTDRSELQQQSIMAQTNEFGQVTRETSGNSVDWSTKLGWYMDLQVSSPEGERVVSHALLRYDRVIFVTVIPSTDTCSAGGDSWLMELDAITGAATVSSSFDFNSDGKFDDSDLLASGKTASGIKSTVGISKPPVWFVGTGGVDIKILTGTSGALVAIDNDGNKTTPGGGSLRRTYWLQIQ